jgi:PPM family protein phosphatase
MACSLTFEIFRRVFSSNASDSPEELFQTAVDEANSTILEISSKNPLMFNSGTSMASILINPDRIQSALVCHIGCNRVYLLRDRIVTQLTRDHSKIEDLISAGIMERKDAWHKPMCNIVTRSIGIADTVEPEIQKIFVHENDRFIICSSDVTEHVCDAEILQLYDADVKRHADRILNQTINRGNRYNPVVQIINI